MYCAFLCQGCDTVFRVINHSILLFYSIVKLDLIIYPNEINL